MDNDASLPSLSQIELQLAGMADPLYLCRRRRQGNKDLNSLKSLHLSAQEVYKMQRT